MGLRQEADNISGQISLTSSCSRLYIKYYEPHITIQEQVQMLINTQSQVWTFDDPHSTIELDIKHKVIFISSVFRLNIGVCAY